MRHAVLLLCSLPVWAQDFAAIDRMIQENLPPLSDGAVLLLEVNGQPLYAKAYGRFTLDTQVPIASATKWISGAVVMAAVDEGLLSLDDRAGRWIPAMNTGAKARITIRQLFSHTSGLPGGDGGCLGDARTTLAACVEEVAQLPLIYEPGTAFYYGGNSMQVAARVVEIVSGRPFTQYYREKIAGPLGFRDCVYNSETNPRIAGGIACTAGDYLRFLRMILNGGVFDGRTILRRAAVDEMLRDQTGGVPILYSPFENYRELGLDIPEPRYGIGDWMEVQSGGEALEVSSCGAFGTCPWVDPRRDLAGVFFTAGLLQDQFPVYWGIKQELRRTLPSGPRMLSAPLHAATYAEGALSPGLIFTLFGRGLGPGPITRPTDTRILFDGFPTPMIFASARQAAGIVPYGVAGRTEVEMVVESNGQRSAPVRVAVQPTAAGLFATGPSEVRPGEIITLWATGEGVLVPPQSDGAIVAFPQEGSPLPRPAALVTLLINGVPAEILYAGGSPGSVAGLLQINARVPEGVSGPARFDLAIH